MDTINAIIGFFPQYQKPIMIGMGVLMIAGRVYHALSNGTGLKGVWQGLIYGTNTPKEQPKA